MTNSTASRPGHGPLRVAVYGAGGVGAYFGARLVEAGHDVTFIARGPHKTAIEQEGLRIKSPLGDAHLCGLAVTDDPRQVAPVDLVLVAVKTWQIAHVSSSLPALLRDGAVVLPLLNGVEASDEISETVGSDRVLGGRATIFSAIASPGVIDHSSPIASIEVGEMSGPAGQRVTDLAATLRAAGIEASATDDIRSALWRKLVLVSSWAGLATASRCGMGPLRSNFETRLLIDRSIDEGIAVARALGHRIPAEFKTDLWHLYNGLPEGATSSMHRDIAEGKPSELQAWNGAVVRFARRCNVPTPVHDVVYQILLPNERAAREHLAGSQSTIEASERADRT